VLEERVVIMI